MDAVAGFRVGEVELTRVPYFDVALDAAVVGLTAEQIESVEWATPSWASADGQVLIGQAVWVVESQGRVIVVDPCGAADQFLREGKEAIGHQEAALGALRDAGFPPERVDVVVLSHLDGIGMAAVVAPDGGWAPAFPNARIVMMAAELEFSPPAGRPRVSTHSTRSSPRVSSTVFTTATSSPTRCGSNSPARTHPVRGRSGSTRATSATLRPPRPQSGQRRDATLLGEERR